MRVGGKDFLAYRLEDRLGGGRTGTRDSGGEGAPVPDFRQRSEPADDDEAFATLALEQAGVAVIPLSPFADQDPPRHLVRLCFAKQDATIDAGIAALSRARELACAE